MALDTIQQFQNLLNQSQSALIILSQNPSPDALCAGFALAFFLEGKNIIPTVAYRDNNNLAEKFSFLPAPKNLVSDILGSRDFILSFNTKYNKILGSKTEVTDDEYRVYVTPERGSIDPRDFSFIPAKFKFDLVFAIGCSDREASGKIYEENPDVFYEVPLINIDNHADNENFGQLNFTEMTAASISEIVAHLLEQAGSQLTDKVTAEYLLAGIISATESFQAKKTTPRSLQAAAHLMDQGADQQKIIRYLYKTQPLQLLKLWGRVMARLKWDPELKLTWAPIYLEDFVQSRSNPKDIPVILEKIRDNYSEGKIFLILYNETATAVSGVVRFSDREKVTKFMAIFPGEMLGENFRFQLENKSLAEAETEVLEKLKLTF